MNLNATLIGQTIAMIVFVWFCMKFIWPPVIAALEARRKTIADGVAAAQEAEQKREAAELEAEELVGKARAQAGEIVDQANRRAGQIVEEARSDGTSERERLVNAAQSDIEMEVNKARETLSNQVATLAVAGAQQILKREIDESAHRDLLDRLAADL